ncbi:MAG: signal peptide peptidase SppA [Prevotella sp.]|nr:signal peptide peptidase SppA [Prevotella sp.]
MKDFMKQAFATVVGILIFTVAMGIIGVISILGMVASTESTPKVKDNSVLVLDLNGVMQERAEDDLYGFLTGGEVSSLGLDELTEAIDKAKADDNVKGIYIEASMFAPDGPASVQALRNKLVEFKKSGKWIVAYGDQYTQSAYWLCSVADKVIVNPEGIVDWHGLCTETMYFKDLLAKFGVKMQIAKVGKFKSAVEPFFADKMSDANREQISVYLNGIWGNIVKEVAQSRKLDAKTLNAYADSLVTFASADELLKMKLVDQVAYYDEVRAEIKKRLGLDEDDNISQVSVTQMCAQPNKNKADDRIAVYYAYGDIVSDAQSEMTNGASICSANVVPDLEALMNDDDVKAVVLRVNSPGGSAYASEQIWRAVTRLKAKKPVVVSMGTYAASGGYYISCAANYIYAEPTTLTGSIGIFGMFPDVSGLLTDKLGLKFDQVKTNKYSNFGTTSRPFNEEEMQYLTNMIDRGYKTFTKRVSDGRKIPVERVYEIAEGRVWLGQDALKIKLVDGIGGIEQAVAKAAELAKVKEYRTKTYPAKADMFESLLNRASSEGGNYLDGKLRSTLGEYYAPFMFLKQLDRQDAIQARMPINVVIK